MNIIEEAKVGKLVSCVETTGNPFSAVILRL